MKPGIVLAAALVAAATVLGAETVDEIVAKNLQARGGLEKLKSIQSVRMSGTLTLGPGTEAGISMEFRRPRMIRTEYTLQGRTAVQAYDGRVAWQVTPFSGKVEAELMTGEDLASMEEQADVEGELVDWKAKGLAVELLGRETVDGVDAWKLRITKKSGASKTMWVDAATFLEAREESERTVQGKPAVLGDDALRLSGRRREKGPVRHGEPAEGGDREPEDHAEDGGVRRPDRPGSFPDAGAEAGRHVRPEPVKRADKLAGP